MRKIFVEAAVAAALVSWVAAPAFAASPSSGSVGPSDTSTAWTGQTYTAGATATPAACGTGDTLCDHFSLSVQATAKYWETHTGGAAVSIEWGDSADNFDLYVFSSSGGLAGSSASLSSTSETAYIANAAGGYTVVVVPTVVTASGYSGAASFSSEKKPPPSPSPSPSPTGGGKGGSGGSGSGGGTGGSGDTSGGGGTGGSTSGGSGTGSGTGGTGSGTGGTGSGSGGTTGGTGGSGTGAGTGGTGTDTGGTGDSTGAGGTDTSGGSDTAGSGAGSGTGTGTGSNSGGAGNRNGAGSSGTRPEPPAAGPTNVGQASGEIFNYSGPLFFPPPFTTAPAGSTVTPPQPQGQPTAPIAPQPPTGTKTGTTRGQTGAPPASGGGTAVQPPPTFQAPPGTIIRVEPASNRPLGVPNYIWVILPMALLMLAAVGAVIFEPESSSVGGGNAMSAGSSWRDPYVPPPPPLVRLGFATRRIVGALFGSHRRRSGTSATL